MEKKKILIIDDEVYFLQMVKPILERAGTYEVTVLMHTRDLANHIIKASPDLILLDIIMPDANGLEVCRSLKNSENTKDIPIVMLSAMDRDVEKLRATQAGADGFIRKPLKKDDLINTIEEILAKK